MSISSSKSNINFTNLSDKTLLLVVENFGLNFSGGSTATARVAEYFEEAFRELKVLCKREGKHNLERAHFVYYDSVLELPSMIDEHSDANTIAFGDFHVAHPLAKKDMPYFFVYHDNWPELNRFELFTKEEGQDTIDKYGDIFANAVEVFSVTNYKLPFISKYNSRATVVRNGLSQALTKKTQKKLSKGNLTVLMAGNIDKRKYIKAIPMFKALSELGSNGIQIHIYGLVKDESIKEELDKFNFVEVKGFEDNIRYDAYDVLLNTSLVENLSLSVVDALANQTPVFSFDVGGIREVVNESNGRIITDFDIVRMAKSLIEFKNDQTNFLLDRTDFEEFDWEKSATKMLRIMNERMDTNVNVGTLKSRNYI